MTNTYRNINELREWLKENSSGAYRPSAHAATVIEEQESELITLRAENADLRTKLAAMDSQEPVAWVTDDYLTDKSATTYSKEVAARWVKKGWSVDYLYKKPAPAAKPARITEQDAREIAEDFGANLTDMPVTYVHVDTWLAQKSRTLLNKLNADREQVSDVSLIQEQWSYYQTLLKQNGFDGITDLLAKYHKLVEQVPDVAVPEGWKLVPLQPTALMLHEGQDAAAKGGCDLYGMKREILNAWGAMLYASPDRRPSHESEQTASPAPDSE